MHKKDITVLKNWKDFINCEEMHRRMRPVNPKVICSERKRTHPSRDSTNILRSFKCRKPNHHFKRQGLFGDAVPLSTKILQADFNLLKELYNYKKIDVVISEATLNQLVNHLCHLSPRGSGIFPV